jgi:hypothetical protein
MILTPFGVSDPPGTDLDLIGVLLSIFIPILAFILGRHYTNRKKRKIKSLIDDMSRIDNHLDLYAWFESISSDGVINGDINNAQLELLRTHYELNKKRLGDITINDVVTVEKKTNGTNERMELYIKMLVEEGYPEENARTHALNHLDKF